MRRELLLLWRKKQEILLSYHFNLTHTSNAHWRFLHSRETLMPRHGLSFDIGRSNTDSTEIRILAPDLMRAQSDACKNKRARGRVQFSPGGRLGFWWTLRVSPLYSIAMQPHYITPFRKSRRDEILHYPLRAIGFDGSHAHLAHDGALALALPLSLRRALPGIRAVG